jgi:hypothetical protein
LKGYDWRIFEDGGGAMRKITEGQYALGSLTLFAFWLFVGLPLLYWPPPSDAEPSRPPQAHSAQAEYHATDKPDGSKFAPFFTKTLKTTEEISQDADDRHEKSSTDWWLMAFTGGVALFTLLLGGATIMLYIAGEKQLMAIKTSSQWQLRAYINASPEFMWSFSDNDFPRVRVKVKNVGQHQLMKLFMSVTFAFSLNRWKSI